MSLSQLHSYVSIQNRKRDDLEVEMSDFGLIDQNGNQYDVVTQDYIENLLVPRQIDYLLINENQVYRTPNRDGGLD